MTALSDFNNAAQHAAETLRPLHEQAMKQAEADRQKLASKCSERQQIQDYAEVIVKAVDGGDFDNQSLSTALAQYVTTTANSREIPARHQQDGGFWIEHFPLYSTQWEKGSRVKILAALVRGTQGAVDVGLLNFPPDFAGALDSVKTASELAQLIDTEGAAKVQQTAEKNATALLKATKTVDALKQATPALYLANPSIQGGITIRNNRGGSININGLAFAGNDITEVNTAQYDRVRHHKIFKAHIESGVLQITTAEPLATAL